MRNLVVHRRKHFVASAMKVRICINTSSEADITLPDANLKVLGELKNGKSLEVEIPEETVDVYVVFDKLFPQRFNSKFRVKAGESPVELHTYSSFSPFKGNPFVISPYKKLTPEQKKKLSSLQSKDKGSTKSKILYWIVMGLFVIGGAIIGWNLA